MFDQYTVLRGVLMVQDTVRNPTDRMECNECRERNKMKLTTENSREEKFQKQIGSTSFRRGEVVFLLNIQMVVGKPGTLLRRR